MSQPPIIPPYNRGQPLDGHREQEELEPEHGSLKSRVNNQHGEGESYTADTSRDETAIQRTRARGQIEREQKTEVAVGALSSNVSPPRVDSANNGLEFMNEPLPPMPDGPRPRSLSLSTGMSSPQPFSSTGQIPQPRPHEGYYIASSRIRRLLNGLPTITTSTASGNIPALKRRSPLGRDKIPGPSSRQPPPLRSPTYSPTSGEPVVYKSVNGPRYRRTSAILRAELGYEPMFIPVRSPSPLRSISQSSSSLSPGLFSTLSPPWSGGMQSESVPEANLRPWHQVAPNQEPTSQLLPPSRNSHWISPIISGAGTWARFPVEDSYPERFALSPTDENSKAGDPPSDASQPEHHLDFSRPTALSSSDQLQYSVAKRPRNGNARATNPSAIHHPARNAQITRGVPGASTGTQVISRQQKNTLKKTKTQNAAATGGAAASSQPQQAGGLFGSTTAASQPAQTGSLFGSTLTQPPQQTGGLFGGTTAASTQAPRPAPLNLGAAATLQPGAPSTGGLFGASTAAATTSQPASGGLFGSTAPAASKPGGLFGAAATTAPAAGGLFGGSLTQPAATQPAAGGLFGSTTTAAQPAAGGLFGGAAASTPAASGGLFGSTLGAQPAAAQPAPGGLFGSTAASQPAAGGLFGARPAAATGGLFGAPAASTQAPPAASNSLFGALNNATTSAQPAQQTVPAVKIDWTNVKPTTRFNELHQEVQDAIVFIDEVIQGAMKASMQCSEALPGLGRQVEALPADVDYLDRRLETVEGALGRDAVSVAGNKTVVERDTEDAVRLFRAIENLKLPNQFHYSSAMGGGAGAGAGGFPSDADADAAGATDLLGYFSARTAELEEQMAAFERYQREVDVHLRTVEHTAVENMQKLGRRNGEGAAASTNEGLREIAGVMRTFEDAILRVAERVGEGRERVVDLSLGGGVR